MHVTERKYICPVCSKAFKTSACLNGHKKTHSDFKPFACEFCDKKFIKQRYLVEHMRSHTGERPFPCDQCDYAAATSGNLRLHKNKRHKHPC